ncbi:hypothetical protein [Bradyrhizobium centrolobii]|nr:hypothetical protein [Bradyrhizobium centrolobii]
MIECTKSISRFPAGHLLAKADAIARRHGGQHVNTIDAGRPCGWFEVLSTGGMDDRRMSAITRDIGAVGGVDALRRKRPLNAA